MTPRRAAIALSSTSLRRIRAALRRKTLPTGRWVVSDYLSNAVHHGRQPAAVGCSSCQLPPSAPAPRGTAHPATTARLVIKRLGVKLRERSLCPRGATRLPIIRVDWAIAHRRGGRRDSFVGSSSGQLGVGSNIRERLLTGRAEVIERASALLRKPDIYATSPRRVRHDFLPIDQWCLYTREQYACGSFPFRPIDSNMPIDWVWATDLACAERLLVPAAFTMTSRLSTPRFVCSSSNGVATHTSTAAALRSAMLEVIERDALQLAWYTGAAVRPLDLSLIEIPGELAEHLNREGWKLRFGWLQGRARMFVAVVVAEMQAAGGRIPRGACVLCSAAAGQIQPALLRATREVVMATEAIAMRSEVPMDLRRVREPPRLSKFWNSPSLLDIALLYLNPLMQPAVCEFLRGTPGKLPARQFADDVASLLKRFEQEGLRALSVDLSLSRSKPFVTYQVIVLGTQPLAFGTGVLRLGSGLLPQKLPSRSPPLPTPGFRVDPGTLNPYILPLA